MKVAAIQYDIAWADRVANFAQLEILVADAARNGARFVVLPEMFSTGFVVDDPTIAEEEGGPSAQFLSRMAAEHNIWICGSCPETHSDDVRPYNSLVLASPHGISHRYRKIHPFTYGGEDKHFRAGEHFVTVDVDNIRVSLFVCYDLRFANEFWQLATNTDLYVVPANWPTSRREHWLALLKARAIENQAYVVGVNRVGTGGNLEYSGDSRIFDPLGSAIAEADNTSQIIYADVDASVVQNTRQKFPFIQDRR